MLQFITGFFIGFTITAIIIVMVCLKYLFDKEHTKGNTKPAPPVVDNKKKTKPTPIGFDKRTRSITTVGGLLNILETRNEDELLSNLFKVRSEEYEDDYKINKVDWSTKNSNSNIVIEIE